MSASRLELRATWSNLLFLPKPQLDKLNQVAARFRQVSSEHLDGKGQGSGGSVLFEGAGSDAKRMAAETLAKELDLDLYRIDLSTLASKFIGETEKNLRSLFDAAVDGGIILFFDEADALFGKRTQVEDSHDRFSNNETSYLLTHMDLCKGLAILASNQKEEIDEVFLQRFSQVIQFPEPEPEKRKTFWKRIFSRLSLRSIWRRRNRRR